MLPAAILWGALRVGRASLPLSVLYLVCALPCSLLGIYSGTFFGHVLSGLLLVLAWRAVFDSPSAVRAGLHRNLDGEHHAAARHHGLRRLALLDLPVLDRFAVHAQFQELGRDVAFGTLADCVESAVAGISRHARISARSG